MSQIRFSEIRIGTYFITNPKSFSTTQIWQKVNKTEAQHYEITHDQLKSTSTVISFDGAEKIIILC
jgi:hypothetical protein